METATNYLLRRIAEEGRDDLIEAYHAHNRKYQRHIAIARKEKQLTASRRSLANAVPGSAWHARLTGRIARDEAALAKMKEMQDDAAD